MPASSRLFITVSIVMFLVPALMSCSKIREKQAERHWNIANDEMRKGDYELAEKMYTKAAKHYGESGDLLLNRARCRMNLKNFAEALSDLDAYLAEQPDASGSNDNWVQPNRGYCLEQLLRYPEAVKAMAAALPSKDGRPENGIAWLLTVHPESNVHDPARAITLATTSCEKSGWINAATLDTLAAAYAANGQFDKAIEFQEKAIEFQHSQPLEHQIDFGDRLELYKNNRPYAETHAATP